MKRMSYVLLSFVHRTSEVELQSPGAQSMSAVSAKSPGWLDPEPYWLHPKRDGTDGCLNVFDALFVSFFTSLFLSMIQSRDHFGSVPVAVLFQVIDVMRCEKSVPPAC